VQQFHTSVTERGGFRDCRRRWYLDTYERLQPRSQVPWALYFGTVIHTGLEAYYRSGRVVTDMLDAYQLAWKGIDDELVHEYGGMYKMGVEETWWDYYLLGEGMLRNYDAYDRQTGWFDEVIEINLEERGFVPIRDLRRRKLRGRPLLSGRIDLVVRKGDDFWVWDHKTAAQKPSYAALDLDDQGTGYCYITWQSLGIVPKGFLYNVLLKRLPKDPVLLASSGRLSVDKSRVMTYPRFMEAIEEHGHDPAWYTPHLEELKKRGYDDFFKRDTSVRNLEQLKQFEKRVYIEYKDMRAVIRNPRLAYPNPNQRNCPGCSVLPICYAMEENGNVEAMREMYVVADPRHEIPEEMKVGDYVS
jgi:hypothetical protein